MIDVRDLSRSFGRTVALDHVSFRVEPGEIVALLGPNGAGKTTASRIIAGILAPSEGDVLVDGISVRADPGSIRVRCGMVTDQPSLYERMTLRAYLEFFCRLYDVSAAARRTEELAALLSLTDRLDVRLGAFSRGMKRKAAIARGLVHAPPVLLLDEPATALDPETARSLRSFIVSLRARHRAILLCTHDLDEAQRIADRVVVLYRGRVAREGLTGALRADEHPRFVVSFTGDVRVALDTLARRREGGGRQRGQRLCGAPLRYRRARHDESRGAARAPREWAARDHARARGAFAGGRVLLDRRRGR